MGNKLGACLRRRALGMLPLGRRKFAHLESRLQAVEARFAVPPRAKAPAAPRPSRRPSVAEQRAEVDRLLAAGTTQAQIARRFGVSRTWIHKLARRRL